MGDVVLPLRCLALREGSALSYAPVENATAPGQVSLTSAKILFRIDEITRKTSVYGIIGDPIAHSLSPQLQNAGFQVRKINAVYFPFLVPDLQDFLAAVSSLGVRGFSVTLPYKRTILRYLDNCDPLAFAIGAVNTVVVRGSNKLYGYNTDYVGVLRALQERVTLAKSRVLILGAGGSARAVAFALGHSGASVCICARRPEEARKLARAIGGEELAPARLKTEFFDAIVNATPVGMYPQTARSPLAAHELNCRLVFDLIYRPVKTKLLQLAARRGIETVSGLEMFLEQGIAQWEIWTGQRAPAAAMRKAVFDTLGTSGKETFRVLP
jgi:3-dehydroquinate dehydratase/shikimate dehydrogenase